MTLLTKRLNAVVNFVFSSFKEINSVLSHINRNGFGFKEFQEYLERHCASTRSPACLNQSIPIFQCARQCRPTHSIKDLNIHSATYEYFWCWTYLIMHRHPVRLWGEATIPVLWIATIKVVKMYQRLVLSQALHLNMENTILCSW